MNIACQPFRVWVLTSPPIWIFQHFPWFPVLHLRPTVTRQRKQAISLIKHARTKQAQNKKTIK